MAEDMFKSCIFCDGDSVSAMRTGPRVAQACCESCGARGPVCFVEPQDDHEAITNRVRPHYNVLVALIRGGDKLLFDDTTTPPQD